MCGHRVFYGFVNHETRKITDDEHRIIYNVLDKINEDTLYHYEWMFQFNTIVIWKGLQPNPITEYFEKKKGGEVGTVELFEMVKKEFEQVRMDMGFDYVDAIRYLERKGAINVTSEGRTSVRITNNPILAHRAIQFIETVSKLFPNDEFFISYRGNALYCPVRVKNGLAKPDLEEIYWELHGYEFNFLVKILRFLFKLLLPFKPYELPQKRRKFYEAVYEQGEFDWLPLENFVRPFNYEALIGKDEEPYIFINSLKDLKKLDKKKDDFQNNVPFYSDTDYYPFDLLKKGK